MKFRTGWLPDPKPVHRASHHELMAAAPPSLPTPNHMPFRKGEIWQASYGMCTGESTTRCGQLWYAMNGVGEEVMLSGAWNYLMGLLAPYDGEKPESVPEKFPDDGASPSMEFQGLQSLGLLLEEEFPSPQSVGFDPARMFRAPTSADLVEAYDATGLQWRSILFANTSTLRDAIRAVMVRRGAVKIAMFVDSGVMNNTGQLVTSINDKDSNGGGHDITVLDASNDGFAVLDNWWRVSPELAAKLGIPVQPWGAADGTWRVTWECLFRHCRQALAFTGAPLVKKADVQALAHARGARGVGSATWPYPSSADARDVRRAAPTTPPPPPPPDTRRLKGRGT
ncbi:MAG TPA: hypothetical protein VK550_12375 [Polyangiaceae bacterium]|nr:hypothetical protein [Polyangiaceae bacterium]